MRPKTRAALPATSEAARGRPRIVLMRHGRPDLQLPRRLSPREWPDLLRAYDGAGVSFHSLPAGRLAELASECDLVLCSPLRRSIESARMLGCQPLCDDLYREVALPHASWNRPRLHPYLWAAAFRGLWTLGVAHNGEDREAARLRAREVARRLSQWANARGTVLLVGHGLFNQLIARSLREDGWQGPRLPGIDFWSFGIYTRP